MTLEETRERARLRARAYRARPGYVRAPHKRDACPGCGGSKLDTSPRCRPCANALPRPVRPVADRLWERVDRSGDCWLWTGAITGVGYGHIYADGRLAYTHRLAYELTYGPIPEGLFVCHHCDNPPCCRPEHLFLGTAQDNQSDMAAKGRASNQFLKRRGDAA